MHRETVGIPLGDPKIKVSVVSNLKATEPGHFAYLQAVRRGHLNGKTPQEVGEQTDYPGLVRNYAAHLAAAVEGAVDAFLSPPSDHLYLTEPYRQAFAQRFPDAIDLTGIFDRTGDARAAKGAALEEIVAGLFCRPTEISRFRHMVVIDDILERGRTVTAIITHLRANGLPEACAVTAAYPLWLIPKKGV